MSHRAQSAFGQILKSVGSTSDSIKRIAESTQRQQAASRSVSQLIDEDDNEGQRTVGIRPALGIVVRTDRFRTTQRLSRLRAVAG